MNPAGDALTDLWVVVALGVTTLVLLTTWACRRLPAARFQRGAWLTCLVAAVAGQVQAGQPLGAEESVAAQAGAGAGAAGDESAGEPPAQAEPTTGQAKGEARPKKQLPKKQPPKSRVPSAAQQRPRRPAGMGMQGGGRRRNACRDDSRADARDGCGDERADDGGNDG